MAKFVLTKTLKLDDISDDWKGCFITITEPTLEEIQAISKVEGDGKEKQNEQIESMKKILQSSFVSGKGFNGKAVIGIEKEDLNELPITIYMKMVAFLTEGLPGDQKESKN